MAVSIVSVSVAHRQPQARARVDGRDRAWLAPHDRKRAGPTVQEQPQCRRNGDEVAAPGRLDPRHDERAAT
jgi:hypothetical protein